MSTPTCRRCRRRLTAGDVGSRCRKLDVADRVLADVSPRVAEAARADLEDRAVIPLGLTRPGGAPLYGVVASDGSTYYGTTRDRCSCPAGQVGRTCHHVVAVRLVEEGAA